MSFSFFFFFFPLNILKCLEYLSKDERKEKQSIPFYGISTRSKYSNIKFGAKMFFFFFYLGKIGTHISLRIMKSFKNKSIGIHRVRM